MLQFTTESCDNVRFFKMITEKFMKLQRKILFVKVIILSEWSVCLGFYPQHFHRFKNELCLEHGPRNYWVSISLRSSDSD